MLFRSLTAAALLAAAPAFSQDAQGTVTAYLAAWNAHDSTAAAALLAENASYYDASVGTPVEGRAAAKENVIDAFLNAAPDAKWEPSGEMLVAGNRIAFEWVFSGTNTGDWHDGTKATGKPFSFHGMSSFTVENGLITHQADYYDALGFYKQLGLM